MHAICGSVGDPQGTVNDRWVEGHPGCVKFRRIKFLDNQRYSALYHIFTMHIPIDDISI